MPQNAIALSPIPSVNAAGRDALAGARCLHCDRAVRVAAIDAETALRGLHALLDEEGWGVDPDGQRLCPVHRGGAPHGSAMSEEFHPLANLFPLMNEAQLQELAEDIRRNGLQ